MAIIQTPSIAAVVEDQTPQLGGNLDCQDYQLQWSGSSQFIGSLVATAGLNISSGTNNIQLTSNGIIDINTDGASRAKFEASGGLSVDGAVAPMSVDSLYDLGKTALRWNTVYADSLTIGDGVDAILTADAADELALRNSTNAQQFNVYGTYTDASNYERLEFKWDTNRATIGPDAAGTGSQREIQLTADAGNPNKTCLRLNDSNSNLIFRVGSSQAYTLDSGEFRPEGLASRNLGNTTDRWSTTYTKGIATNVETFTAASDTLDVKNNVALCDCTSNNITINLPTASTASGLQYHIKKTDSSSNTVTVDGNGSQTIDGATTATLTTQYESITIVSDGSNWFII